MENKRLMFGLIAGILLLSTISFVAAQSRFGFDNRGRGNFEDRFRRFDDRFFVNRFDDRFFPRRFDDRFFVNRFDNRFFRARRPLIVFRR